MEGFTILFYSEITIIILEKKELRNFLGSLNFLPFHFYFLIVPIKD
jgi:hypothetical protein